MRKDYWMEWEEVSGVTGERVGRGFVVPPANLKVQVGKLLKRGIVPRVSMIEGGNPNMKPIPRAYHV